MIGKNPELLNLNFTLPPKGLNCPIKPYSKNFKSALTSAAVLYSLAVDTSTQFVVSTSKPSFKSDIVILAVLVLNSCLFLFYLLGYIILIFLSFRIQKT